MEMCGGSTGDLHAGKKYNDDTELLSGVGPLKGMHISFRHRSTYFCYTVKTFDLVNYDILFIIGICGGGFG
jgi:hypothetical protein